MTATGMDDQTRALAARLAESLAQSGVLLSPEWDAAVRAVPRHVFVPRVLEQLPDTSWRTVSGDHPDSRAEWLTRAYSDEALYTQLRVDASGRRTPISSSSKPGLTIRMLETLQLADGHRVLEIGTGTGYNAGLMCHRLGDTNVASVDLEPELVDSARTRLALLGYSPTLAAVDGADGLPDAGPFDRIMATCSVPHIPTAWIDQLGSDGRILTDVKITGAAGNLVDLRSSTEGLHGRFLPKWAGFMPLRHHRDTAPLPTTRSAGIERCTDTPSARPWWDDLVVWFLAALRLPNGVTTGVTLDQATMLPKAATIKAADGSWAEVSLEPDASGRRLVRGSTPDLWEIVEHAYSLWSDLDRPGWDRFGLTVHPDGRQSVWLDQPDGHHSWALDSRAVP